MPRDTTTRKRTAKEASAIRSRVKNLIGREIGQATILKDQMKEREFSFVYQIDDMRSLAFKITVSPVPNKVVGFMAALHVHPGKPP